MAEYASKQYWNDRFTNSPTAYEWLLPPEALQDYILETLILCTTPTPRILHIGCGTSNLSFELKGYVDDVTKIHNTDYSSVAIKLGREGEERRLGDCPDESERMQWSTLDLLSKKEVTALRCEGQWEALFDMVVDKATSDSIACGEKIRFEGRYPVQEVSADGGLGDGVGHGEIGHFDVEPVTLLAVHLAWVMKPGGWWVAISYRDQRFHFHQEHAGRFPDARRLWRLVRHDTISVPETNGEWDGSAADVVCSRLIDHHVYILERTDVLLHDCEGG